MIFDLKDDIEINEKYKLMTQTIIPRPIAWIVTEDNGVINAAPFSFFIGLTYDPATVLVSVGHKSDGSPKDTLANIRKNKKCTICMVDENNLEMMHLSSKSLDKDVSEIDELNIKTNRIFEDFPPMISTTPVAYKCTLNQEIELAQNKTIPIVLNIEEIFVKDECIIDKENLTIKFKPVARVGKSYAFLGEEITPPTIL